MAVRFTREFQRTSKSMYVDICSSCVELRTEASSKKGASSPAIRDVSMRGDCRGWGKGGSKGNRIPHPCSRRSNVSFPPREGLDPRGADASHPTKIAWGGAAQDLLRVRKSASLPGELHRVVGGPLTSPAQGYPIARHARQFPLKNRKASQGGLNEE
jgi:hypothetical protein